MALCQADSPRSGRPRPRCRGSEGRAGPLAGGTVAAVDHDGVSGGGQVGELDAELVERNVLCAWNGSALFPDVHEVDRLVGGGDPLTTRALRPKSPASQSSNVEPGMLSFAVRVSASGSGRLCSRSALSLLAVLNCACGPAERKGRFATVLITGLQLAPSVAFGEVAQPLAGEAVGQDLVRQVRFQWGCPARSGAPGSRAPTRLELGDGGRGDARPGEPIRSHVALSAAVHTPKPVLGGQVAVLVPSRTCCCRGYRCRRPSGGGSSCGA